MMYPRGPKIQSEHAPGVVAQAARLGAELGADIVKTNYTGDVTTFKEVVRGCPVPVIIAGGPFVKNPQDFLKMVHDSLEAGASGISIGRNVFQHRNPFAMTKALSEIVHRHTPLEEALETLGEP
jgi:fructose-bisphosphate aldolase/2-amino-3,7-dideoxy-D-threo-hept-6-ulosonate synthase